MIGLARHTATTAAVIVVWCLSGPVATADTSDALLEAGQKAAARCAECHGRDGMSENPEIPHLAGQHAEYLLSALKAYKEKTRAGEDMQAMVEVVETLSLEDMAKVAGYFGSLTPFTALAANAADVTEAARQAVLWDPMTDGRVAAEACGGCHGEDGNSEVPGIPGLAGQPRNYLLAAMEAYKDGSRVHDEMQAFAMVLDEAELEVIARYYAALEPEPVAEVGPGDAMAGRAPSAACMGCHGEDGNSDDAATPRLAGLDATYLMDAMQAYKAGTRGHAVMQDLIAPLDTTDIENLSAFYAAKLPKGPSEPKPMTVQEWTERCDRCHGDRGIGTDPRFPILAGQSKAYLVKALTNYHGGQRENSMMYAMSFPMGLADIEHLAAYYAGQIDD